jgi:hypothetical protein
MSERGASTSWHVKLFHMPLVSTRKETMPKPYWTTIDNVAHDIAVHFEEDVQEDADDEEASFSFKSNKGVFENMIGVTCGNRYFLITITEVNLREVEEAVADLFTNYEGEGL